MPAEIRPNGTFPAVTYLSVDPLGSSVGLSQVVPYVEGLAGCGVNVRLVSFEHSIEAGLSRRLAATGGVEWCPLPYGRPGSFGGLGRALRAARAVRGAELVHARSDLAAAAVILSGVDRWVWDVRSLWVDQKIATGVIRAGSPEDKVFRHIERAAAARSSQVVTLTGSVVDELERRYGAQLGEKTTVITTCVELDRFVPVSMPKLEPVRLLLAGTLNRYYDIPAMLGFVEELRRHREVEFIVAAPGSTDWDVELDRAGAKRLTADFGEMPGLVASCHAGLCLCREDAGVSLLAAMPTKIGEFLAVGRPVVVNTGLVDASGLVSAHQAGVSYSCDSVSPELAVEELLGLLKDPETPRRARLLAEEHFDLEAGIERLIDVYQRAVD